MLGRVKKGSGGYAGQNYKTHTLIAVSTHIKGDVEFEGELHIQGSVQGEIRTGESGGRLVIGQTGSVRGQINVPDTVINGQVDGDVHAAEHLELAENAVIEGNVFYSVIEMVMGATVNGKLVRVDADQKLTRRLEHQEPSEAVSEQPSS